MNPKEHFKIPPWNDEATHLLCKKCGEWVPKGEMTSGKGYLEDHVEHCYEEKR